MYKIRRVMPVSSSNQQPDPTSPQRFNALLPLYTKLGFGVLVLFGMVGNCLGKREQSLVIFVLVSVMWSCIRIVTEAIDAYRALMARATHSNGDDDLPPGGPIAPT